MKNITGYVLAFLAIAGLAYTSPPRKRQIFLVGDSAMADKQISAYPETGWGMMFAKFVDTSVICNHARNGRSTKSFLAENRWAPIINKLQPVDMMLKARPAEPSGPAPYQLMQALSLLHFFSKLL